MKTISNPFGAITNINFLAALAAFVIVSSVFSAAAEEPAKKYGYTDTPFLPNSKWRVHDIDRPQPPIVEPGDAGLTPVTPPKDATILFDGKDLSQWQGGNEAGIENGCINILKTGELRTKQNIGDFQMHVEWATPAVADGGPYYLGNSGVIPLGLYEVQIIESYAHQLYADGIAGAIYGQTPPMVNVSRKPGEWQSYDIGFEVPQFDGEKLVKPAYLTVVWNGVLVQNHQAALGPTKHRALGNYDSADSRKTNGPVVLQLHGSAVRFRNIWIRPLKLAE